MESAKEKPRNHKCDICGKCFLGKSDLSKHILIHTGAKPFKCQECDKCYRQSSSLKDHYATHHASSIQGSTPFVCEHCDKSFPLEIRLRLHLRTHTGYKPYQCPDCPKTFARCAQLTQHSRTHTGYRPYKCEYCESTFSAMDTLKYHKNTHLKTRPYACDECGKGFLRPDKLKKHISRIHEDISCHCDICNKDFKGHLSQHMRMHSQVKSHVCSTCGSSFAQRNQLMLHQRKHTGVRPYHCKVCKKEYINVTDLKQHTRLHTGERPFQCKLCLHREVRFSQLAHLKKHMFRIHKTDKFHFCDYCDELYKTRINLEQHHLQCKDKPVESIKQGVLEPQMSLENMRLLLAVLLNKIGTHEILTEMGFNKLLIDNVLNASITASGRNPCTDVTLSVVERLKKNIEILLEWTIPQRHMDLFTNEQYSTEQVLELLTNCE